MRYKATLAVSGVFKINGAKVALKPGQEYEFDNPVDHPFLELISEVESVDEVETEVEDVMDEEVP